MKSFECCCFFNAHAGGRVKEKVTQFQHAKNEHILTNKLFT